MATLVPGDTVRTPLGTGIVREVRRNGRLVVLIGERAVVVEAGDAVRKEAPRTAKRRPAPEPDQAPRPHGQRRSSSIDLDLHGLVVADALERVAAAVNAAILAGHGGLRIVHGRSGGRLRLAVHQQLRALPSVRAFRVDAANDGVTIVEL